MKHGSIGDKMAYFSRIRIYNEDVGKQYPTHVEIDGKRINGVTSIQYDASVDSVPRVTLELNSLMESGIDIDNAELRIKFHPKTVHEAMVVLGITGMCERDGSPVFLFDDGK